MGAEIFISAWWEGDKKRKSLSHYELHIAIAGKTGAGRGATRRMRNATIGSNYFNYCRAKAHEHTAKTLKYVQLSSKLQAKRGKGGSCTKHASEFRASAHKGGAKGGSE